MCTSRQEAQTKERGSGEDGGEYVDSRVKAGAGSGNGDRGVGGGDGGDVAIDAVRLYDYRGKE